ncbi:MAG: transglutaminase domain-containing protein [Planctomycetaceae bacterium]|jgi:hypothetical protein|nr:transglutaminase domain-containing protein [Planctomycetaceae bacterium]
MNRPAFLTTLTVAAMLWLFHPFSTGLSAQVRTLPQRPTHQRSLDNIGLADSHKQQWEIGMTVRSPGVLTGVSGTITLPLDWPEQKVTIIKREIPDGIKIQSRIVGSDVKQMLITIARVNPTPELRISFTVEVERWSITAPQRTNELKIPTVVAPELRKYMGVSPSIETTNPLIVKTTKGIGTTAENDWQHVEMIYDWVRKNIRYEFDKELQGALTALRNGKGDCEELTSLFIAICRNHGIPARSVWIPGHCYPEFYLVDRRGNGYWFPAQVAGTRNFGSMPERRPVLQKGDNFRIPGNPRPQRYVAETFKATRYSQPPTVQFFRRQVTASKDHSDDPFAPVLK